MQCILFWPTPFKILYLGKVLYIVNCKIQVRKKMAFCFISLLLKHWITSIRVEARIILSDHWFRHLTSILKIVVFMIHEDYNFYFSFQIWTLFQFYLYLKDNDYGINPEKVFSQNSKKGIFHYFCAFQNTHLFFNMRAEISWYHIFIRVAMYRVYFRN